MLDGPPQPLDEDAVMTAATSVHADADAVTLERPDEGFDRELAALVGVEDLGRSVTGATPSKGGTR